MRPRTIGGGVEITLHFLTQEARALHQALGDSRAGTLPKPAWDRLAERVAAQLGELWADLAGPHRRPQLTFYFPREEAEALRDWADGAKGRATPGSHLWRALDAFGGLLTSRLMWLGPPGPSAGPPREAPMPPGRP